MRSNDIIIGISGASGIVYALRLLEVLAKSEYTTHLVVSKAGQQTRQWETDLKLKELAGMADHYYQLYDFMAPIASGSFKTLGMIVAPCSMRTLADIALGTTDSLLTRAADVVLKERRKLVILPRETPLHLGHIKNMQRATEMGAIIAPPVPSFYIKPKTVDDIINDTVGRTLDLFDIDCGLVNRWPCNN